MFKNPTTGTNFYILRSSMNLWKLFFGCEGCQFRVRVFTRLTIFLAIFSRLTTWQKGCLLRNKSKDCLVSTQLPCCGHRYSSKTASKGDVYRWAHKTAQKCAEKERRQTTIRKKQLGPIRPHFYSLGNVFLALYVYTTSAAPDDNFFTRTDRWIDVSASSSFSPCGLGERWPFVL